MTDGTAWLAVPQPAGSGGHSIVMSRELASDELVSRITATVRGPRRTARAIGSLSAAQVQDLLEGLYGQVRDGLALRHGEAGEWSFACAYGGRPGAFDDRAALSREGAHVFVLDHDPDNYRKAPGFEYGHDGRSLCSLNLYLDGSRASWPPVGDPETVARVREALAAAGLPDDKRDPRTVHRDCLQVLEKCFGLSLPRREISRRLLPTVLLTRT
ncbi:hypothetical protein J7I94_07550 [Streptomyces sp. ISL-12]|uniref:hypothetical protein n=1 Tax=Streptomyces sp. ISL-12 TaxID=2819177 RepID=UPI001BEA8C1B|nr:hypothetical protein [Streptomyces sp. ISL-12]MBT2410414.1 hypothetical protein [Streptomyces sp. ISL-12]